METSHPIVISSALPEALRDAAIRYATSTESDELAPGLIETFGIVVAGDEAHRRAVWLCVLAVRKVLWGWRAMECKGDKPAVAIDATAKWVQTRIAPADWKPLCVPAKAIRRGKRIVDCDTCRVGPIASAAALTARFALYANHLDAAEVLSQVWSSINEGIFWPDAMPFEAWVVTIALPASYDLRPLTEQELRS